MICTLWQRTLLVLIVSGAALAFAPVGAGAQEQPDKSQPATQPDEQTQDTADPLGNLDDLLDIPDEDRDTPRGEGDDDVDDLDSDKQELARRLTAQEINEQFLQAIAEMGEAAQRMARAGDVGIQTQRLQEEILTKLDILIKESQKSSSQGGGGKPQQGEPSEQGQQPSQPQQSSGQQQEPGQGENRGETNLPGFQSPELRRQLDAARAAWGDLPARMREALIDGLQGKQSTIHKELTQEFYRRLAEDRDQ